MIMTPFADFSWAFLPFLPSWGPSPCLLGPLPLLPRWSHTQLYACKLQTYSPCLGSTPVSISNFRAGRGCERFLEPILLHQFFLFTITFSQTRNLGRFHLIPFSPLNNSILMIHPWVLPSSSFFPRRKTKKSYPLKLLHYSKKFSPLDSRLLAIQFTWGNLAEHTHGCALSAHACIHTHTHSEEWTKWGERDGFLVLLEFSLYILLSILVLIPGSQAVVYCGGLSPEVYNTLTHPDVPELVMVWLEGMMVGTHS